MNGEGETALNAKTADWIDGSKELESFEAKELLGWALRSFHPRIALACSFQAEESVLIDTAHWSF